ncbi:MAG: hypothetical protein JSS07_03870 [Proteobacteria bacterium]|nr:hypothetical protein [Pseudomonadota bacterium]
MKSNQRTQKKSEAMNLKTDKPKIRRIGFDLPDSLLKDFKSAVSLNETTMTAKLTEWMEDYCCKIKRERGMDKLTK